MAAFEVTPQERHIVVAGFYGSGHERLAAALARRLNYPIVTTFTRFVEGALRSGDVEQATGCELAALKAVAGEAKEPSIIDIRTPAFCRHHAQDTIKEGLGALSIYYRVPAEACHVGIMMADADNDVKDGAGSDLHMYNYRNYDRSATGHADLVVEPEESSRFQALADTAIAGLVERGLLAPPLVGAGYLRIAR